MILFVLPLLAMESTSRADALLSGGDQSRFPESIALRSEVKAQVETLELDFEFADLAAEGDYRLTVPTPDRAYVIGVELDRGQGFAPLAMEAAPPAQSSGVVGGDTSAVQEWQGLEPLRAELSRLAAGPLRVRVRFQRLLRRHNSKVEYSIDVERCPLRPPGDNPSLTIEAAVETLRPLAKAHIGQQSLELREGQERVELQRSYPLLHGSVHIPVSYAEREEGIGFHFLSHRTPRADPMGGQDGYFLILLSGDAISEDLARKRTLNLVIDRSGSMSGDKLERAKEAAQVVLDSLRGDDAFAIRAFDDVMEATSPAPMLATPAVLESAADFVEDIEAAGGTDLHQALTRGLGAQESDERYRSHSRFDAMVLLSDGQATSGETNRLKILEDARTANRWGTRIYTYAIGAGADLVLLEALAREARGKNIVLSEQQARVELVARIGELFEDIRALRLANLEVSMPSIGAQQMLPERPGDLFSGGQVVLVGRYQTAGSGSLVLRGDESDRPYLQELEVLAPDLEEDNAFIKTVWAMEKVSALRAQLATATEASEVAALEEEIRGIGLAYQLQTPYTSFSTSNWNAAGGGENVGCAAVGTRGTGLSALLLLALALLARLRRRAS